MDLKLELGQLVATPGALEVLSRSEQSPWDFVRRHAAGDWGDVCAGDARLNDAAVRDGGRLLSVYHTLEGVKLWIITEAADGDGCRAATTILLPDEY